MSVQAMTWAWEQELPMGPKAVLVAIANHADGEGVCYPGQARLARMAGCNERSVRNFVRVLEAAGLIERGQRRRPDGSRTSDEYRLIGYQPARDAASQPARDAGSDEEPTGKPRPTNRHVVPPLPARGAGHEPSVEPSEEPSVQEHTRKRATPKFDPLMTELPKHVDPTTWAAFVTHRREIHKPLTPTATERLIAMLRRHPTDANAMLDRSTQNGWTGVFPPDNGAPARRGPSARPRDDFSPDRYQPTDIGDLLSPTKGSSA